MCSSALLPLVMSVIYENRKLLRHLSGSRSIKDQLSQNFFLFDTNLQIMLWAEPEGTNGPRTTLLILKTTLTNVSVQSALASCQRELCLLPSLTVLQSACFGYILYFCLVLASKVTKVKMMTVDNKT